MQPDCVHCGKNQQVNDSTTIKLNGTAYPLCLQCLRELSLHVMDKLAKSEHWFAFHPEEEGK